MEDPSILKDAYRTCRLVGVAVMASLLVYAVIVATGQVWHKPFLGPLRVAHSLILRYAFYGAAIAIVVVTRILNSLMMRTSVRDDQNALIRKLSRTAVVSMSLGEGPAVLGLALFLLGGFSRDFYMLLAVSLVLEFMYFPRLRNWQDFIRDRAMSCRL